MALAARYYAEVVWPLLNKYAPRLPHSAGLIGWGSEVLGLDSPRSTDHNWGQRCQIFLGLTPPVDGSVRPYYDRPYRVIDAGRFVASLRDSISVGAIRRLPLTGAADQFIDSTDAIGDLRLLRAVISVQLGP